MLRNDGKAKRNHKIFKTKEADSQLSKPCVCTHYVSVPEFFQKNSSSHSFVSKDFLHSTNYLSINSEVLEKIFQKTTMNVFF